MLFPLRQEVVCMLLPLAIFSTAFGFTQSTSNSVGHANVSTLSWPQNISTVIDGTARISSETGLNLTFNRHISETTRHFIYAIRYDDSPSREFKNAVALPTQARQLQSIIHGVTSAIALPHGSELLRVQGNAKIRLEWVEQGFHSWSSWLSEQALMEFQMLNLPTSIEHGLSPTRMTIAQLPQAEDIGFVLSVTAINPDRMTQELIESGDRELLVRFYRDIAIPKESTATALESAVAGLRRIGVVAADSSLVYHSTGVYLHIDVDVDVDAVQLVAAIRKLQSFVRTARVNQWTAVDAALLDDTVLVAILTLCPFTMAAAAT